MKLLTVAIPAYNAERYLDDCLSSVFHQGLREDELEVILVNDGSLDSTLFIAQRWAREHPNMRVIDQETQGVASTRNLLIELANGEYFAFLDADDIVATGAYARAIAQLKQSGSDFVTSAVYRFSEHDSLATPFPRSIDLFHESRSAANLSTAPEFIRDVMLWNKVFRRSFIVDSGLRFPDGKIYEDVALMPLLFEAANTFDVLPSPLVFWRVSDGSITHTFRPSKATDRLDALLALRVHFSNPSNDQELIDELDFAIVDYNLRWLFQEFHRYDAVTKDAIVEVARELVSSMSESSRSRLPLELQGLVVQLRSGQTMKFREALEARPVIPNLRVDGAGAKDFSALVHRARQRHAQRVSHETRKLWRRLRNVFIYLVFRPLVHLLPLEDDRVFVANYWGQKFSLSDGPAAIAARLSVDRPRLKITILSTRDNKKQIALAASTLINPATRVTIVKNESIRYFLHLWRAKYLFNDVNFSVGFNVDRFVGKRPGQIEVQTTHGTPLKKMGVDSDAAISAEEMPKFLAKSKRYDFLVAPSPEVGRIFADSHAVSPPLLKTGLPQNDILFSVPDSSYRSQVKVRLGLDPSKKLIVYSPTYRYGSGTPFPYSIDFAQLAREFGEEYQMAIKIHPFAFTRLERLYFRELTDWSNRPNPNPFIKLFGHVQDGERGPLAVLESNQVSVTNRMFDIPADINDLMVAADVLITDYSSILFNYPHLGKPLIIFAPDKDFYESNRGMYFNLSEIAPGAFTTSNTELIQAIALSASDDLWEKKYGDNLQNFKNRFHVWERGDAAAKILGSIGLL